MKRKIVSRLVLLFTAMIIINSCEKSGENSCRTCHARYNGETIKSEEKCSSEAEQEFKSTYYYATVTCD